MKRNTYISKTLTAFEEVSKEYKFGESETPNLNIVADQFFKEFLKEDSECLGYEGCNDYPEDADFMVEGPKNTFYYSLTGEL